MSCVTAGIPLSLVGVAAYGVVTLLAGRMVTNTKERASKEEEFIRWLLLASTTAMAVASSYFIYILNVKLDGASCSYCYGSALLSVSLLLSTLPVHELFKSFIFIWSLHYYLSWLEWLKPQSLNLDRMGTSRLNPPTPQARIML